MTTSTLPPELVSAPLWAQDLYENSPPLVDYWHIAKASCMSKGSVANLHSEGNGPQNGIILGRKRVFPRLDAILWLVGYAKQHKNRYTDRTMVS